MSEQKFISKPTIFVVKVNDTDYTFAALTMKDFKRFVKAEQEAFETKEPDAVLKAHRDVLVAAFQRAGVEVTEEDLEEMDAPLFNALFAAVIEAHNLKLEAKVGEQKPH
jgi:hypothetical protein